MSTPASIATYELHALHPVARSSSRGPRSHKGSRPGLSLGNVSVPVSLNAIEVSPELSFTSALGKSSRLNAIALGLTGIAVVAHLAFGIYVAYFAKPASKPVPHELAMEIVVPKPPEPKIEPPKPEPPKPQPIQKQAQVLPPIQTTAPEPSQNTAVSTEPPVAVAPIVSAPPAPEPPLSVTAPTGKAGYLNNPQPNYPPAAARAGWQGTVKLRVHVLSNGRPDIVDVQTSSGRKVLDDEAVRTVKTWTFSPAKRGDTPVDGWANVPIEFALDQ